jgi:hypothetical protein
MNPSSTPRIIASYVMVAVFGIFAVILLPIAIDAGNTEVMAGFGWFALLMIAFFILLALDWLPGTGDDSCAAANECHCENRLTGARKVKQPVNTWSDLGFVAAGLLILLMVGAARLNGVVPQNPMQSASFYSIAYGLIVIYLGPGSMFYHASIKKWGGWLDNMSMVLWTTFLLVYVIARGAKFDDQIGIVALIFLLVVAGSGAIIWFVEGSGKFIFGGMIAVWGVLEIIILIAGAAGSPFLGLQRTEGGWLLGAALSFGLAVFIWLRSNDGGPWCYPHSWAQGHAAWHLLSALSTFFIFLYLRSEIMV